MLRKNFSENQLSLNPRTISKELISNYSKGNSQKVFLSKVIKQQEYSFGKNLKKNQEITGQKSDNEFVWQDLQQKHVNFLEQKKLEQLNYYQTNKITQSSRNSPVLSKYPPLREFSSQSTQERLQTACDYQQILEKEPLFIKKKRRDVFAYDSTRSVQSIKQEDHGAQTERSQKFPHYRNQSPFQFIKTLDRTDSRMQTAEGSLTSRGRVTKFTNNILFNQTYSQIWRDFSLDHASREKVIQKLRETKHKQELEKRQQRSQQRIEKALKIKQLISTLDLKKNDIQMLPKFSQLPLQQIEYQLKDISQMKQFINATIKIQSFIRMFLQKRKYLRVQAFFLNKIKFLQGFFRARYAHRQLRRNLLEKYAKTAITLQRFFRGFLVRKQNLLEQLRMKRFRENLEFLDQMNKAQKEVEAKEREGRERKQKDIEEKLRREQERLQPQLDIYNKLEILTHHPPLQRKASRKFQVVSTASQKAQSARVHSQSVKILKVAATVDINLNMRQETMDHIQEEQKEEHDASMIQGNIKRISQQSQRELNELQNLVNKKNYEEADSLEISVQDVEQISQFQKDVPNYMRNTMSNMCKEMQLNDQKIHEIMKKNNLINNLQNKQQIGELITIAAEDFTTQGHHHRQSSTFKKPLKKQYQRAQSQQAHNKNHKEANLNNHFNQKNQLYEENSFAKSSQNVANKELKTEKGANSEITDDLYRSVTPMTAYQNQLENNYERPKLENREVNFLHELEYKMNLEDKSLQTSVIQEEEKIQEKKEPERQNQEIQVELIASKYNYLSNQPKVEKMTPNSIQKQLEIQQVSRSQRKKILREQLYFDKFVTHTKAYEHEPLRFKCLQIHNSEPYIAETPTDILAQTFYTPQDLFFVYNHGKVPRQVAEEDYCLYILGCVQRPIRITMHEIKTRFEKVHISATLRCAANRKKEFDQVKFIAQSKNQLNDKFGNGAIGTALWGGVRLRDVLKMAQIEKHKAKYIEFYGDDIVNESGKNYCMALKFQECMDKHQDIILAFEMNNEPLSRDHGHPLRLIVPGQIGAKSVKWLSRIMVLDSDSSSLMHQRDFKLFPPSVDSLSVKTLWSLYQPITFLNIDSGFLNIQNGDVICRDRRQVIKGYAISGQGNYIQRVELSFDQGNSWIVTKLTSFKDKRSRDLDVSNKKWEWTTWEYVIEENTLNCQDYQLWVKATDEASNTQSENINHIWNFKGYMNNSIQKICIKVVNTKVKGKNNNE